LLVDHDWKPYPVINLSLNGLKADTVDVFMKHPMGTVPTPTHETAAGKFSAGQQVNWLWRRLAHHPSGWYVSCESLNGKPRAVAKRHGLEIDGDNPTDLVKSLIRRLSRRHEERTGERFGNNVEVLVDEYDAPVLDHAAADDLALAIHSDLDRFYTVLKSCENYIRFLLITGVAKFVRRSMTTRIDSLVDLTFHWRYASICGFTIEEFDSLFGDHVEAALESLKAKGPFHGDATTADLRRAILSRYDGYTWDGKTRILNPWTVLNCLYSATLDNFWFSSGSPALLIDTIRRNPRAFDFLLEPHLITEGSNALDVGGFEPVPLMFQTGYLTVGSVDYSRRPPTYDLRFPNLEVREALLPLLVPFATPFVNPDLAERQARIMVESPGRKEAGGSEAAFSSLLAQIPFHLHTPAARFYHSIFHLSLKLSGLDAQSDAAMGGSGTGTRLEMADGERLIVELQYLDPGEASDWPSMSPEGRRGCAGRRGPGGHGPAGVEKPRLGPRGARKPGLLDRLGRRRHDRRDDRFPSPSVLTGPQLRTERPPSRRQILGGGRLKITLRRWAAETSGRGGFVAALRS
jgi:hypothetical protein